MQDRAARRGLAVIGGLALLVGVGAALLGPAEMYCFYLFSEGGRFHYDGFGFGSFMFGNIAFQIIGYYVIAAVAVPLSYGHLCGRRWARPLAVTLLWFWRVVGIPLVVVFLFILTGTKELSLAAGLIVAILLALSYFVVPGLLLRFYDSPGVRRVLESRDPRSYKIERLPIPTLVLCVLYLFYLLALHLPIFFNGVFPLFGTFFFGLPGILLLEGSMVLLVALLWGTWKQKGWAWWGGVLFFGLMTVSVVLTFLRYSYLELLAGLNFPPREIEFLDGIPLQGFHLALFFGIPLLATVGVILLSRRHLPAGKRALNG